MPLQDGSEGALPVAAAFARWRACFMRIPSEAAMMKTEEKMATLSLAELFMIDFKYIRFTLKLT